MTKTAYNRQGRKPVPTTPDRRPLLVAGGFVALGLAAALFLFGGSLNDRSATEPGLQSIPEFSETTAGSAARPGFVEVGQRVPTFQLASLSGETVDLADYEGRPMLLNFWATWCPPCRMEMPHLERASRDYADAGLVVVGVNQQESTRQVTSFVEEMGLSFPMLVDPDGRVGSSYGASSLPMSVFVDAEGRVTAVHRGGLTQAQIDDYLSATIAAAGS